MASVRASVFSEEKRWSPTGEEVGEKWASWTRLWTGETSF
jgi:hypothetical protein